MEEVFGNRSISISRELTKIYEETFRGGNIDEALNRFEGGERVRGGEFVLVIEGEDKVEDNPYESITIEDHIKFYMEKGLTKKDAVKKSGRLKKYT